MEPNLIGIKPVIFVPSKHFSWVVLVTSLLIYTKYKIISSLSFVDHRGQDLVSF